MMTGDKIISYLILYLFFGCQYIHSQSVASVKITKDSVGIGDHVIMDIKVILPADKTCTGLDFSSLKKVKNLQYSQDTTFMDTIADLEVLDFGDWKIDNLDSPISADKLNMKDINGQLTITNHIAFAVYNTGAFEIQPPIPIFAEKDVSHMNGKSVVLHVKLPEKLLTQDTVIFNPIKDIIHEKSNITDYLPYLYAIGAFILCMAVGYYFYKIKNQKPIEVTISPQLVIPCHEKALTALKALDALQLWQQGQIKEYQTGLTDIIRTYLMERYGINAPEMTTDEILQSLVHGPFDKKYNQALSHILQIADLVKFAKAKPGEDIHASFMQKAIDFVENTKDSSHLIQTT